MTAYQFRTIGLKISGFGEEVQMYDEPALAEELQNLIGELAWRTGHTTKPDLPLQGSFNVVLGTDEHTGHLVVGLHPEAAINEATL